MLFTGLCVQVDDTLRGSLPEEEKKNAEMGYGKLRLYVRSALRLPQSTAQW